MDDLYSAICREALESRQREVMSFVDNGMAGRSAGLEKTLETVNERLRVIAAGENVVVAGFGNHQRVPDVARRVRQQMPALGFEYPGIAIPSSGELRRRLPQPRGRAQIRHRSILSCVNQPNPTTQGAFTETMASGPLC